MGIGLTVVFSGSSTGWSLSQDGRTIAALTADQVAEALTHVRHDVYCALDGSKEDGTPVPYLDAVPAAVWCYPYQVGGVTGGGLATPGLATN
jgi:hypothetical protein